MMIKNKLMYAGLFAAAGVFWGCATLQDVVVSSEQSAQIQDIRRIEQKVAELDGAAILSDGKESAEDKKERAAECEKTLGDISKTLTEAGMQEAQLSRLWALRGRTFLLTGDKNRAAECYKTAVRAYKGDAQAMILANRLRLLQTLDDKAAEDAESNALFTLESAINAYKDGAYVKAIAQFDGAFIALPDFYRDAYAALRTRAWNFRNVAETTAPDIRAVLEQPQLTAGQAALLAADIDGLLYAFTAGKKLPENALFSKLAAAGLFSARSSVDGKPDTLSKDETFIRVKCARFLWNLFIVHSGEAKSAVKYSNRYRSQGAPSPVPDVPAASADFDAVLGCIETELMELPDGEHFFPQKNVSALEFAEYLKTLRSR